jgi:hypothetical protein
MHRARLEVAAAYQQVDGLAAHLLQALHCAVYLVQIAVTAALHSYLRT